jgi:hypothetical protein
VASPNLSSNFCGEIIALAIIIVSFWIATTRSGPSSPDRSALMRPMAQAIFTAALVDQSMMRLHIDAVKRRRGSAHSRRSPDVSDARRAIDPGTYPDRRFEERRIEQQRPADRRCAIRPPGAGVKSRTRSPSP